MMKKFLLLIAFMGMTNSFVFGQNIAFSKIPPPPPSPQNTSNIVPVNDGTFAYLDIDNDSDLDIIVLGELINNNYINIVYKNDGYGNFTEFASSVFDKVKNASIAYADIDNDNDLDVFIAGDFTNNIYIP